MPIGVTETTSGLRPATGRPLSVHPDENWSPRAFAGGLRHRAQEPRPPQPPAVLASLRSSSLAHEGAAQNRRAAPVRAKETISDFKDIIRLSSKIKFCLCHSARRAINTPRTNDRHDRDSGPAARGDR
jgi:hypothetical protein